MLLTLVAWWLFPAKTAALLATSAGSRRQSNPPPRSRLVVLPGNWGLVLGAADHPNHLRFGARTQIVLVPRMRPYIQDISIGGTIPLYPVRYDEFPRAKATILKASAGVVWLLRIGNRRNRGLWPFLCPNCGVFRLSGAAPATQSSSCAGCGSSVTDQALYCSSCGATTRDIFAGARLEGRASVEKHLTKIGFDPDWVAGKNAIGHFQFAKAMLASARQSTGSLLDLPGVEASLVIVEHAMASLEEALISGDYRNAAKLLLIDLDHVYGALLARSIPFLESSAAGLFPPTDCVFEDEPFLKARASLERTLGQEVRSYGGVGLWERRLVDIQFRSGQRTITAFDRLAAEAARFQNWETMRT